MKQKHNLKKIILLLCLSFLPTTFASAQYYNNEFSGGTTAEWYGPMKVGREGYLDYSSSTPLVLDISGGNLRHNPNNTSIETGAGGHGNSGAWMAAKWVLTNRLFQPSFRKPIGFVVRPKEWYINTPSGPTAASGTTFWGVEMLQHLESSYLKYTTLAGKNFENFLQLFNRYQVTGDVSYWGAFVNGVESRFLLTNAQRADGRITNFYNHLNNLLQDNNATYINMPLEAMIIHYGNSVEFYMQSTNILREHVKLGTYPVSWSSNVQIGVTMETKDNGAYGRVFYDYLKVIKPFESAPFVVRDGADSDTVIFSTSGSDKRTFVATFTPEIGSTNSGVNVIELIKPTGFGAWSTNTMKIVTDVYRNNGSVTNIIRSWSAANMSAINTNEAIVRVIGDTLWIRLGRGVTSATPNKKIVVRFDMATVENVAGTYQFDGNLNGVLFHPIRDNFTTYSTCGRHYVNSPSTVNVISQPGPVYAYSSISPQNVVAAQSVSLTFFLNAKSDNTDVIRSAAFEIPPSLSSAIFTNFNSVLMGDAENTRIIRKQYPSVTNNDMIFLDYSGINIPSGGLDVITFDILNPTVSPSNHFKVRVDSYAQRITNSSKVAETNATYPSQRVNFNDQSGDELWDYQIVRAGNVGPVSITRNKTNRMAYLDVIADGQSTSTETITSLAVNIFGNRAQLFNGGLLHLYRSTNTNTGMYADFAHALHIQTIPITSLSTNTFTALLEKNQSQKQLDPTRYWVAITVTNGNEAIFGNSVGFKFSAISASGPGGGLVDAGSLAHLIGVSTNLTRIDTHKVYVSSTPILSNNVRQGSFNNLAFKMVFSNSDPDATNYLLGLKVSNYASAGNTDLGFLKIFKDSGNGTFNVSEEQIIMAGSSTAGGFYNLSVFPPSQVIRGVARHLLGSLRRRSFCGS